MVLLFYEIVYTVKIILQTFFDSPASRTVLCIVQNVRHLETNKQTKLLIAVFGHIMFELFQRFGTYCS